MANDQDSGANMLDSLASYDPSTSSWKTSQRCYIEGLKEFSEIWPRSGTMQNGIAYRLPTLARLTEGIASGLLPTPTTQANQLAPSMQKHAGCRLLSKMAGGVGGVVSPMMYEWQMGFPMGWTDLNH